MNVFCLRLYKYVSTLYITLCNERYSTFKRNKLCIPELLYIFKYAYQYKYICVCNIHTYLCAHKYKCIFIGKTYTHIHMYTHSMSASYIHTNICKYTRAYSLEMQHEKDFFRLQHLFGLHEWITMSFPTGGFCSVPAASVQHRSGASLPNTCTIRTSSSMRFL